MESPARPLEVVLIRRYPHPVARVFRAFADARQVEQWMRPDDEARLEAVRFDFREGGEFLLHYHWRGAVAPVSGRFLAIVPDRSIVYSWEPQPPDPYAGKHTRVAVSLRAVKEELTEVELRHTLFADSIMTERHEHGWQCAFKHLSRFLDQAAPTQNQNTL